MHQPSVTVATAPGRPLSAKLLTLLLLVGLLVFWVIFLAGTAASQQACVDSSKDSGVRSGTTITTLPTFNLSDYLKRRKLHSIMFNDHGRHLLGAVEDACSNQWSFPMWLVWFQFFLMNTAIALSLSSRLSHHFGQGVAILFAINTGLLMAQAGEYNSIVYAGKDSNIKSVEKTVAAARAAMAGIIPIMILNMIYIIAATERTGACTPGLMDLFGGGQQQGNANGGVAVSQQHFPEGGFKVSASTEMPPMPPPPAAPYAPGYEGGAQAPVYNEAGYPVNQSYESAPGGPR